MKKSYNHLNQEKAFDKIQHLLIKILKRMGNTCKPLAVSFQCMTKSTTNKKKKNSQESEFRGNIP